MLGLGTMFITLTGSGLVEGFMSMNLVPRETILTSVKPFWIVRAFTGLAILAGFSCLVTNMWMTARASRAAHVDTEYGPYEGSDDEEVALGAV